MLIELLAVTAMIGLPSGIATRVAVNNYRSHDPDRIAERQVQWCINTDFAKPPAAIDWKRFEHTVGRVLAQSKDPDSIDGQNLLASFEEGVLEQQTIQQHVDANGWHCASCKILNKKVDHQCQHCGNGFRGGGPFTMGVTSLDIIEASRGLEVFEDYHIMEPRSNDEADVVADAIVQFATDAYSRGIHGRDIEYIMSMATQERGHAVFTNTTSKTIKTSMGTRIEPGEAYAVMPNEIVLLGAEREKYDFYDQGAMTKAIASIYGVPPHQLGESPFEKPNIVVTGSRKESGPADSLSARPRFSLHGGKRYICPSCGHESRTELTHCTACNKRIHWR